MAVISMKQLLEAGVHFGHQTRRWNPKMATYIFTERNGIYIIDLQKTVKKLEEAYFFVRDMAAAGESILFVGTKKQAQDAIKEEAERCGHVLCQRSLAGRHADQLQDHAYPYRSSEPAAEDAGRTAPSICSRRRKLSSSSSRSPSSRSTWAALRK